MNRLYIKHSENTSLQYVDRIQKLFPVVPIYEKPRDMKLHLQLSLVRSIKIRY